RPKPAAARAIGARDAPALARGHALRTGKRHARRGGDPQQPHAGGVGKGKIRRADLEPTRLLAGEVAVAKPGLGRDPVHAVRIDLVVEHAAGNEDAIVDALDAFAHAIVARAVDHEDLAEPARREKDAAARRLADGMQAVEPRSAAREPDGVARCAIDRVRPFDDAHDRTVIERFRALDDLPMVKVVAAEPALRRGVDVIVAVLIHRGDHAAMEPFLAVEDAPAPTFPETLGERARGEDRLADDEEGRERDERHPEPRNNALSPKRAHGPILVLEFRSSWLFPPSA